MSNFVRQRGFLDPNRLLHAPQFSYGVSIIYLSKILDLKIVFGESKLPQKNIEIIFNEFF